MAGVKLGPKVYDGIWRAHTLTVMKEVNYLFSHYFYLGGRIIMTLSPRNVMSLSLLAFSASVIRARSER